MPEFERFFISQVGILIRDNKCLILEFSKYPNKWGLPGGRIDKGEMSEEAFRREFREELGFDDFEIFDLIDHEIFYTESKNAYCAIVKYVENSDSEISLSHEHLQYKWISEDEIDKINFIWKNLPRMIKRGFEYHRKLKK